jgi:hypothetical protein
MKDVRVVAAAGVAVAAALAGASAFAQEEEITDTQTTTEVVGEIGGPEIAVGAGFTIENVDPNKPFGDLDIDPKASRETINAGLTSAEEDELKGRCVVIMANELSYETSLATFCTSYLSEVPTELRQPSPR